MNTHPDPLLSIRDLVVSYPPSKRRGEPLLAVRSASLDIRPGELLGLVGESGSGKSSLARAILRLEPAASGTVRFHGRELPAPGRKDTAGYRRRIQFVFQDSLSALSPRRTIAQSLIEPLNHFGLGTKAGRADRVLSALEQVGLDPGLKERLPAELSGGQRQRAALARALVTEPELIIADEPLSSLDLPAQARILELIGHLRESLGVAFLLVSHDLSVVRRVADRVAVMYLGRIVEQGPADRILASPAHPYTRALLASVPVPDPDHPSPSPLPGEPPSLLTPPPGCVFHKRCPDCLEICSAAEPPQTVLGSSGTRGAHRVNCHLWSEPDET